ncbi:hypothetical protein GINT2_002316 [Glugoides intestinalis]
MKTTSFRILRFFCTIIMLSVIILNLVSIGYQIYNRKLLSIEKMLMPEKKLILKNCAMFFAYMNILVSFTNIYAYNVAIKFIMRVIMWFTVFINLIGSFCILYLHAFAENHLRHQLTINIFSMEAVTFMLQEMFGMGNPLASKDKYIADYNDGLHYFLLTEGISITLLSIIVIASIIRQFMKVHVEEEDVPEIKERMIINIPSMRSRSISIAS